MLPGARSRDRRRAPGEARIDRRRGVGAERKRGPVARASRSAVAFRNPNTAAREVRA
jgi:hypothetical protein